MADEVVGRIQRIAAAPVDAGRVRTLVEVEWARYDQARVRTFVPVLVSRAVLSQLLGRR